MDIAWRADDPDSLFVVDQGGRIRIVRDGALVETPFLDIAGIVTAGGEQGLLGLAFHPNASDRRFFVYYTALDGDQIVASYETMADDRDRADPDSEVILLDMPDEFGNHNGGGLVFGPDGYLYISTGDGGGGGDPLDSGRHLDTLLAKVLRIDIDAGAPAPTRSTRSPPTTPSSRPTAPAGRSGSRACATRGASASTGRPVTCGSATSGRTSARRSTSPGPGSAVSTSAGTSWRARPASATVGTPA